MRVVIIGAGAVGFNLAERLAAEQQDVVVVELDPRALRRVTDKLDVQAIEGRGSSPQVLLEAGIEEATLLIAVTDSDEVNMLACVVASACGRPSTIKVARVRDEVFFQDQRLQDRLARVVDLHINPERVAAEKVLHVLSVPAATDVVWFADGKVQVIGLPITERSPLAGVRFADLAGIDPDRKLLVAAISRLDGVVIPKGSDRVCAGDTIYAVTQEHGAADVLRVCGYEMEPLRRVMIAGSTNVAVQVAKGLEAMGVATKLIERDKARCYQLADELSKAVILHGDPTDPSLLGEEFVDGVDAFVAASADEEENILSAVLARRLGAKRTIALTDKAAYLELIRAVGVDVVVSPRLAAVSSILQFVRRGRILSVAAFGEEAEALEFEATEASSIVGKPLRKVRFPRGALVGAVFRKGQTVAPSGEDVIQAGDRVVVFALKAAIPDVERLIAKRSFLG